MSNDSQSVLWPGWDTGKILGEGSYGAVYEIERVINHHVEKAALKVISIPKKDSDIAAMYDEGLDKNSITLSFRSHLESILNEYHLMRELSGTSHIVNCDNVRYVQHSDGIGWDIFIKMELLTPLTQALPADIPVDLVVKLAKDMCSALDLCERYNIIHRDIKPPNIFMSRHGDFKLGDFGIAKTVEKIASGTLAGTYKYMAPEVYHHKPYGNSADICSLGLVLYWLLNERRAPFEPPHPVPLTHDLSEKAQDRRFSGEPLPPPLHGSDALKRIVLKACADEPQDRYATAAEMLADLNHLPISETDATVRASHGIGAEPHLFSHEERNSVFSVDTADTGTVGVNHRATQSVDTADTGTVGVNHRATQSVDTAGDDRTVGVNRRTTQSVDTADDDKTVGVNRRTTQSVDTADDDKTIGVNRRINVAAGSANAGGNAAQKKTASGSKNISKTTPQKIKRTTKKSPGKTLPLIIGAVISGIVLLVILILLLGSCQKISDFLDRSDETEATGSSDIATKPTDSNGNDMVTGPTDANNGGDSTPNIPSQTDPSPNPSTPNSTVPNPTVPNSTVPNPTVPNPTVPNSTVPNPTVPTPTVPVGSTQTTWSDWMDQLPANVTASNYEIETKLFYRSRTLMTTFSTTSSSMAGWELYDTVEAGGGFSPWSQWSQTAVSANSNREVQTQTQYRYRDKETTTSTSSSLSGWTLDHSSTSWGDYGSWSSWSTSAVSSSDSRKVETKIQYRYRDITQSWSSWSEWSYDRQSTSSTKKEEARTLGGYYYYVCPKCGAHMPQANITCKQSAGGCGRTTIPKDSRKEFYLTTSWNQANLKNDLFGTNYYYADINGERVFKWDVGGTRTQYRYSTLSTSIGSWSSWGDTAQNASSTREVETRTVFRYCDRSQVTTYYFYRWGSWSNWSTTNVSSSSNREVQSATFYRYREKVSVTTYFFRKWSDWSGYSDVAIKASDTVQVDSKTMYRYRSKAK